MRVCAGVAWKGCRGKAVCRGVYDDGRRSKILSFLAVLRINEVGSRHSEIGNVEVAGSISMRMLCTAWTV